MGKEEVLNCLGDSRLPLSSKEVAELLNEAIDKTTKILTKLIREINTEVKVINLDKMLAMKFYGCKHKMRLFYI